MVNLPVSKSNEQHNDDLIFSHLSKIEDFIITDKQRSETFANYVKHFSDLKCALLPSSFNTVTPLSVHVHGFESEQIYQQLKSINEYRFKPFLAAILKSKTKQKTFGNLLRPPSPEKPSSIEENIELGENNDDQEDISKSLNKTPKKKKKSVTFFDSHALNKFLDEQDIQEISKSNRKPSEDDDLEFDDDDDDDEENGGLSLEEEKEDLTYDEFFDPPAETKQKKKSKQEKIEIENDPIDFEENGRRQQQQEEEDDEDEEEDINLENKSDFEKQQIYLKRQIKYIEKDMLSAKPWQLAGETDGHKRPENSLLEEYLQYDRTTRLAPVITNETTDSIEDLIKQRIRDRVFDDVERKKKPTDTEAQAYKKEIVLEHEKSKMSLAQVYEQEYLKKQTNDKTEKKDERHEAIRQMMQNLFVDLDALSNFRFTPKPPVPEVTIVNNLPAILIEEVVPTTVSDSALLAPEEVHLRPKGDIKADSERTDTDKKHARRLLKHKLKLKSKATPKATNPEEEEKEEKRTLLKKLGKMKNVRIEKTDKNRSSEKTGRSSTKFFQQLQQSTLTNPTTKRRHSDQTTVTDSKRLKL